MRVTYNLMILFSLLSFFSCIDQNQEDVKSLSASNNSNNGKKLKDSVQLFFKPISPHSDSLEITLKYYSALDTIKLSGNDQRFRFLYFTLRDISLEKLEESVKNDNWSGINKDHIQVLELDTANSANFNFSSERNKTIKGVIDDIVFLKNYNEKGETRIIHHITKFEENLY